MNKKCTECKVIKDVSKFYVRNKLKPNVLNGKCNDCIIQYNTLKYRASNVRLKIIERLGARCKHCGFADLRALQIDHINGGGKREILSYKNNARHYYRTILKTDLAKYQILCANCNWIKRYVNKECRNDR